MLRSTEIDRRMINRQLSDAGRGVEMEKPMSKTRLLECMRATRQEWDQILGEIDASRMTQSVLHGGWSVKDTIGHVAYYERWVQGWLEAAVRGQVTLASDRDSLDVDARNAIVWGENRERSLQEILRESKFVFDRLLQLVQVLPEADLIAPYVFDRYVIPFWGRSMPLWECIADDSYDHYREHIANLCRWLESETAGCGALHAAGSL
ncbi:MAG TPA: ClbS/DfsB family four-helix bundle protein [Anaerolineae bacterium]